MLDDRVDLAAQVEARVREPRRREKLRAIAAQQVRHLRRIHVIRPAREVEAARRELRARTAAARTGSRVQLAVASAVFAGNVGGAAGDEHRAHAGRARGLEPGQAVLEHERFGRLDAERLRAPSRKPSGSGLPTLHRRRRRCARADRRNRRRRAWSRNESITERGLEDTTASLSPARRRAHASGAPGIGCTSVASAVQYVEQLVGKRPPVGIDPRCARGCVSATCSQVRPRVSVCGSVKPATP